MVRSPNEHGTLVKRTLLQGTLIWNTTHAPNSISEGDVPCHDNGCGDVSFRNCNTVGRLRVLEISVGQHALAVLYPRVGLRILKSQSTCTCTYAINNFKTSLFKPATNA